jgi:ketosteroid isomerase-like protein
MLRLTSLILLFALSPPAPRDDAHVAAAREVEQLERDLVAAIGRGDLATYDRIVADDYVAFPAAGEEITKGQILESYRSGTRKYTNLEIFDVRGRVFGDTAIVTAKTRGMRRENGREVPNRVRYIRVFARRDGRWRAVAQMAANVSDEGAKR